MSLLLFWLLMAIIVAVVASINGLGAVPWFFYALLVWPVALIHVLVKPRSVAAATAQAVAEGRRPCPFCAEMIKREAKLCPHCRQDLTPSLPAPS